MISKSESKVQKYIKPVRGMKDLIPEKVIIWNIIEKILKNILNSYGYHEIRIPVVEYTNLFKRAIGESTDVIEKETYSFNDRNGRDLTLRPEGTAGCVRASIEHRLLYHHNPRLWYIGPMFRNERPQKGRYRQFHQLGCEVFGDYGPYIDVEILMLNMRWWKALGITKQLRLEINSIGSLKNRINYVNHLVKYLTFYKKKLDKKYHQRIANNPLRLFESKDPYLKEILRNAPTINNYLDKSHVNHFSQVCVLLDKLNISYHINYHLLRGLDYYNNTVFEWKTDKLGTQDAVCSGGRYDYLVEILGGERKPGIGFAVGLERLVALVESVNARYKNSTLNFADIYLINQGTQTVSRLLKLAELIRDGVPEVKVLVDYNNSYKKQLKYARKLSARIVIEINDNVSDDYKGDNLLVNNLKSGKKLSIKWDEVIPYLIKLFHN